MGPFVLFQVWIKGMWYFTILGKFSVVKSFSIIILVAITIFKLKIVEKIPEKLKYSYSKVSHALNNKNIFLKCEKFYLKKHHSFTNFLQRSLSKKH